MTAPVIEEWRSVVGYEGYYDVSNLGRVKSLRRVVANGPGVTRVVKQSILTASGAGRDEYAIVNLAVQRKNRTFRVNILVLEAFIGPRPTAMVSCHGDGCKQNNALSNLRWDTQQANIDDKAIHGTNPVGEKNAMAKFSNDQIAKLKAELRGIGDMSYTEFGRIRGLTRRHVSSVASGKRWASVEAAV